MGIFSIFSKKEKKEVLDAGLEKTKSSFFGKLTRAIAGKSKVDDEVLDQLEEILITSDVGTDTTIDIIHRIEERVARDKYVNTAELHSILKDEIGALLTQSGNDDTEGFNITTDRKPYVIMMVGVNGVGKTTTIGKLAYQFKKAGLKVVLGAADTFRDEILLVLDGSTGQNAYEQAKQFIKATDVTALAITKLDGTAKGGVVIGISHQLKVPVKYIGLGEKMTDLQPFNRQEFVNSLFENSELK